MKKLLSLFGSIGLCASSISATTQVVSCDNTLLAPDTFLYSNMNYQGITWGGTFQPVDEQGNPAGNPIPFPQRIEMNSFYKVLVDDFLGVKSGALDSLYQMVYGTGDAFGFMDVMGIVILSIQAKMDITVAAQAWLSGQIDKETKTGITNYVNNNIVKNAYTIWGAAQLYATINTATVADLMNTAVYDNAAMVRYFVRKCGAAKENVDGKFVKKMNRTLETFRYVIKDKDDKALTKKLRFVISNDSTSELNKDMNVKIFDEDGTLAVKTATKIEIYENKNSDKVFYTISLV